MYYCYVCMYIYMHRYVSHTSTYVIYAYICVCMLCFILSSSSSLKPLLGSWIESGTDTSNGHALLSSKKWKCHFGQKAPVVIRLLRMDSETD